jgi:4-hydroxybutyrate dehydrogenase
MKPPTISYLTNVYFEPGAAALAPELLAAHGVTRPLVVTDKGLVALGLVKHLNLPDAVVFDAVETNPTEASVLAALDVYTDARCNGVVALGGGSPMDCAKAVALLDTHAPPLEQYALIRGGLARITADKPPVFAVPTTAGTGSEVGRGALVTVNSGEKLALISPHLIPTAAVCDPILTLQLPAGLTAATGMDAISHCVETFCSPKFNPVTDAIALDGLARAWTHIRDAVADGSNLAVRSEMMMAALEGGLTFQKGLGLIHALSHPLGAIEQPRLHHGTLNAVFLPHVLRFNMAACPRKMDRMAELLGVAGGGALPGAFAKLTADLGLPTRLRDMGVSLDQVLGYAEAAKRDHCCLTNPRPISVDDCRAVFEAAY